MMKILFRDIEEFRACVPWLYKTAEFERFVLDIELAKMCIRDRIQ